MDRNLRPNHQTIAMTEAEARGRGRVNRLRLPSASCDMKAILILLCLLFCVEVYAALPVYSDVRAYVEKHNLNDQTPATNRIYINFEWSDSVIVPCHDGMKLEDVIKQSKFKGKDVFIFVFRGERPNRPETPVYDSRFTKVKSSEFVIRPLDAIHLVDIRTPIN